MIESLKVSPGVDSLELIRAYKQYIGIHWIIACNPEIRRHFGKIYQRPTARIAWLAQLLSHVRATVVESDAIKYCGFDFKQKRFWFSQSQLFEFAVQSFYRKDQLIEEKWVPFHKPGEAKKEIAKHFNRFVRPRFANDLYSCIDQMAKRDIVECDSIGGIFRNWRDNQLIELRLFKPYFEKEPDDMRVIELLNIDLDGEMKWDGYVEIAEILPGDPNITVGIKDSIDDVLIKYQEYSLLNGKNTIETSCMQNNSTQDDIAIAPTHRPESDRKDDAKLSGGRVARQKENHMQGENDKKYILGEAKHPIVYEPGEARYICRDLSGWTVVRCPFCGNSFYTRSDMEECEWCERMVECSTALRNSE